MKVSVTDKEITIIEFSKEELAACSLTYENISRNVIRSKTVIYTIINETAKISGNERVIDENTAIDILPDGEGGCVIILNNSSKEKPCMQFAVLAFRSIDSILDLAKAAVSFKAKESRLYKSDEGYFLCVKGDRALLSLCSEYSDSASCAEEDEIRISEFAQSVITDNALEILGGTASEK